MRYYLLIKAIWVVMSFISAVFGADNIRLITEFLETKPKSNEILDQILSLGSMNGFYTATEYYNLISHLRKVSPDYVSELKKIGRTYMNQDIYAYKIGDLSKLKRIE